MQDHYYELVVNPSSDRELFCELILELTGEAIEEVGDCIYVRSSNPLDEIVFGIECFRDELTKLLGKKIEVECEISKKESEDWIKKYQESITPIEVGDFFITPTWSKKRSQKKYEIYINPALAFGSGHHESTSSCLEFISSLNLEGKAILDVGCGSGILGIACSKKGAKSEICDSDPLALNEAVKNFELNNQKPYSSWIGSANLSQKEYDLVIANIVSDILIAISKDLTSTLKGEAILILSGILCQNRDRVYKKFSSLGLEFQKELIKGEWVTMSFKNSKGI